MTDKDCLERFMYEVDQMRKKQTTYFKSKSETNKKYAIQQEHIVDEVLLRLRKRGYQMQEPPQQATQKNLYK